MVSRRAGRLSGSSTRTGTGMVRKTRSHAPALERVGCNQTPARLALSQIRPVPRRGLSRSESAMYIGISPSKFDALVYDGRMPRALQIDRRKVWDQRELDVAFDAFRIDNDSDDEGWADFAVGSGK